MIVTSRLVMEDGNILPYRAAFARRNRSLDEATKKISDSAENSVSGRGSDIDADAVSFPVIHGPMRAAPLWHAWIGRWVTGLAITTSAHQDPLTARFSACLGVSPRRIEASARRRIRDQVLDHFASLGSLQFIGSFEAKRILAGGRICR